MHIVYVPATNHVLGVHQHTGATAPTIASLAGNGGLRLGGVRGGHPPSLFPLNWGTSTSEAESFAIPESELALRTLPEVRDVFTRPLQYVIDTTQVALIPPSSLRLRIQIDAAGTEVVLSSPTFIGSISFPTERRVWIQVEGPTSVHRRVMSKSIPAGQGSPWHFPLTVDPNGPLAPIPVGGINYFLLVLVEGMVPDARTQTL